MKMMCTKKVIFSWPNQRQKNNRITRIALENVSKFKSTLLNFLLFQNISTSMQLTNQKKNGMIFFLL